jgi:hypothetical protein
MWTPFLTGVNIGGGGGSGTNKQTYRETKSEAIYTNNFNLIGNHLFNACEPDYTLSYMKRA